MIKGLHGNGIAILGLTMLAAACHNAGQQPNALPPASISIYQVQQDSAVYYDLYPATVTALNVVELRGDVAGYITGIFFKDGQHVQAGQKLYEIDKQQYQAAYEQATANLKVAEANLQKAQKDADRYTELNEQDAIAKQTLDYALSSLQSAKAQVAAAKANIAQVATNLNYAVIKAPYSGTIGISQVKLGTLVSPGQTLLNTLSSDDPMAVDFEVNQNEIPYFSSILQHPYIAGDSVFTLSFADGSVYPYPGQLLLMDRAVNPQTGTIKVRLDFTNKSYTLRDGMSCNVRVRHETKAGSILIPFKAVTEQVSEYFVYVVKGNKVHQQRISAGNIIGSRIVVNSGLNLGDSIAVDGIQKLNEGSEVQIVTAMPDSVSRH